MKPQNKYIQHLRKILLYVGLSLISLIMVLPFIWLLSSSFKTLDQIFVSPPQLIGKVFTIDNYIQLFTKYNFSRYLFNSVFIAVLYTAGTVFFCALAGYGFAKYDFKGKNILFLIVLGSMMIPFEATMVPLYMIFKQLNWIDKQIGLIVPGLANAFGIFFMKQFLDGITSEIIESGRIDGCGEFKIFRKLILPLLKPAIASLGIIFFMNSWNSFMWPLIVLKNSNNFTLSVALRSFEGGMRTPFNLIMSGSVVSITPLIIVFISFQKQFIAGITAGAVKG